MSNSKSRVGSLHLDETQSVAPSSLGSISSKLYTVPLRWTGFTRRWNLALFSLTAGIFAIFSAFQLRTLEEGSRIKPNPPGGPFWFKDGLLYLAMQLHLWSVIRKFLLLTATNHVTAPDHSKAAGILLPLQFLPAMRRRYMSLHKLSGRALLVLLLIGNISKCNFPPFTRLKKSLRALTHTAALTMAKHSFGGTITTQVYVVVVAVMTSFSVYKAWASILNLHIDQHRVWVIRTWSYACTVRSILLPTLI